MAHALGSLNPTTSARLEECKAILINKADPEILSQVLLEMGLMTLQEWGQMV